MLLVVAGAAKLRRPEPSVPTLHALGLPARAWLIRAGAAVELAVGAAGLAAWRTAAAAVATPYAGFAVVTGIQLVRGGPSASCGCFGTDDVPPTLVHVVFDVLAAGAAAGAAVFGARGVADEVARGATAGISFVVGVAVATYAAYLVIARLPLVGPARDEAQKAQTFRVTGGTPPSGGPAPHVPSYEGGG